jgi:hypothetical protein
MAGYQQQDQQQDHQFTVLKTVLAGSYCISMCFTAANKRIAIQAMT